MIIQSSKLNNSFVSELSNLKGCSFLAQCYGCGSCSGVCPVEKVVPDFDPRKIVHMVALGMKEDLLKSDTIWACSQCQSCVPVCPQEVRPADIIKALCEKAWALGLMGEDRMADLGLLARVDPVTCVACLTCVRVCPFGAPHVVGDGYAVIEPELCRACGICVSECPAKAISLAPSQEQAGMTKGKSHVN
jgi:heterodisulfide reductase subunit C